jgi:hypothetical protein
MLCPFMSRFYRPSISGGGLRSMIKNQQAATTLLYSIRHACTCTPTLDLVFVPYLP